MPRRTQSLRRRTQIEKLTNDTSPQEFRFCEEYLVDLNVREAGRRAGLSMHEAAALMRLPRVLDCIARLQAARAEVVQVAQRDVLRRWWLLADADVNEVVQLRKVCCPYCWSRDNKRQMEWDELQRLLERQNTENAKRLAEGKAAILYEPIDDWWDQTKEPNPECPQCAAKGGLVTAFFQDSRKLSPAGQILYAGVKVSKDGTIEVKMRDQDHALDMVAQHLGLVGRLAENRAATPLSPSNMTDEQLNEFILSAAHEIDGVAELISEEEIPADG